MKVYGGLCAWQSSVSVLDGGKLTGQRLRAFRLREFLEMRIRQSPEKAEAFREVLDFVHTEWLDRMELRRR